MTPPTGEAMLRAAALRRDFGEAPAGVRAVDGVDLVVHGGELVLIMGPSGSGKTTLLTLLGGLLRPTSGEIWIGEARLSGRAAADLARLRRRTLGFVFQTFNLIEALTALQNVLVVLNLDGRGGRDAQRRATGLLTDLGLAGRLGARPAALSAGERQRVAIARALVNDPAVILADEPTANLDTERGLEVMRLLRAEAERGRAVVVVSHDDRLQPFANRVLSMRDGRLAPGAA